MFSEFLYEHPPTASELKDGILLLLDTYGEKSELLGFEMRSLNLGIGSKRNDSTHDGYISFKSALDYGIGCTGYDAFKRNSTAYDPNISGEMYYDRIQSFEVFDEHDTQVAILHKLDGGIETNISGKTASVVGTMVLNIWNSLVDNEQNPKL